MKSNIARNARELPPDSFYWPINAEYQERLVHSQSGAMPTDDYAKSVVRQVTARGTKPLYVWEGNKSWVIWFVHWFLPAWVKVSFCAPVWTLRWARAVLSEF